MALYEGGVSGWASSQSKLANPNFFVSRTRLSVRNLPLTVDDKACVGVRHSARHGNAMV